MATIPSALAKTKTILNDSKVTVPPVCGNKSVAAVTLQDP